MLVGGSLTDASIQAQTIGEVLPILPEANVVKIGGQSMMDRGRKAMFPIVEELVENLKRHQICPPTTCFGIALKTSPICVTSWSSLPG